MPDPIKVDVKKDFDPYIGLDVSFGGGQPVNVRPLLTLGNPADKPPPEDQPSNGDPGDEAADAILNEGLQEQNNG